ncbi:MAG: DNA polymerase III subunit delta [Prevotellaceae bacterium]|jgi:DNA polymerase-3 subunit delta|nr:DNA polymerase III subunit delta [Prevotellaceae bacterium]
MAKKELSFEEILRALKAKQYAPIYYLMGEEGYYIDRIADYIANNVLTKEEQEFNLTILYGGDLTDFAAVINAAKRYPMMAEHQVVILKEMQSIDRRQLSPDKLSEQLWHYLQKPQPSTLLVLCHKYGTIDRRKKLAAEIEKRGVLFESKRLKEGQVPAFIESYLQARQTGIDAKAAAMLTDFVGTDLGRLVGELDKLIITLPPEQKRTVTPELVEKNIGISKEYNGFELRNALIVKDVLKANKIIKYFAENPKTNPIQMTLALLFNFYANLMLAYYAPDKSEQGIAAMLGLKSPWAARDYISAMRRYSGVKVMQIIGEIRYADARSKGVGNPQIGDADIMRELIFKILH